MIVLFKLTTPKSEFDRLHAMLLTAGCDLREVESSGYRILLADKHWDEPPMDLMSVLKASDWVESVIHSGSAFPLISSRIEKEVRVGGHIFGREFLVIAGPCTVEDTQTAIQIAKEVKNAGAQFFRGGAFKPTTSPYSFGGLRRDGLDILRAVKAETGLGIVTEVMHPSMVEEIGGVADVLQVGARSMQNFDLLREIGKSRKPVLLKRSFGARVDEWLSAAEYIAREGNEHIILCERGIRTFETSTRATLDVASPTAVSMRAQLPVIIDPSHAAGDRQFVRALALAGIAAGGDGLLIEVHTSPSEAIKDGAQAIDAAEFRDLISRAQSVFQIVRSDAAASC